MNKKVKAVLEKPAVKKQAKAKPSEQPSKEKAPQASRSEIATISKPEPSLSLETYRTLLLSLDGHRKTLEGMLRMHTKVLDKAPTVFDTFRKARTSVVKEYRELQKLCLAEHPELPHIVPEEQLQETFDERYPS